MVAPFLGRSAELQTLAALSAGAEATLQPAAAVILAGPGTGKSRLLEQATASGRFERVLPMAGFEPEREIPLAAAAPLLRSVGLLPTDTADLTMVSLFEAIHAAIEGDRRRTLLVVDDLQWVDDSSLALVHYLIRASVASHSPMVTYAAGRPVGSCYRFIEALERLLGSRLSIIELGPLERDDGIRLVRLLAPHLEPASAEAIWERATGSPFWIEVLATAGHQDTDRGDMIERRLASCSDDAMRLTETLAVFGKQIDLGDLAALLDWSRERSERAIDQLGDAGLAVLDDGAVRLAHDLIRAAVAERLPEARRRSLHRQVASWMWARRGDDPRLGLEALLHAEAGGSALVSDALTLLADPSRRRLGREGLRTFVAIAESAGDTDEVLELRWAIVELAMELGEFEAAMEQAEVLAHASVDPELSARAHLAASRALVELGRRDAASTHLEWAAALIDGGPMLVEVAAQRSVFYRLEGRAADARREAETALDAVRLHLADPDDLAVTWARIRVLVSAADAALFAGTPREVVSHHQELERVATGVDDRIRLRAAAEGALGLRLMGRNLEAEARARAAYEEARRLFLPQAALEAGAILGAILLSLARVDEARALVTDLSALRWRLVELVPARAFQSVLPHLVTVIGGDWREGIGGLEAVAAELNDPHYRLHAHLEAASALARIDPEGSRVRIFGMVQAALSDARQVGCWRCLRETHLRLAEAMARIGEQPEAVELLEIGERFSDPHDALARWWEGRTRNVMSWMAGDPDPTGLRELIVAAEEIGLRLEALWAGCDLGRMLGENDEAIANLSETGSRAEAAGAATIRMLADQSLRRLGVRTWRRGSRRPAGGVLAALTDRELEIAKMVAAGASNPEIAEALFLSRRTVERHLSNMLAKVSVRNRAELAGLVMAEITDDPEATLP